jgi:hypothetical protein
MNMNSNIFIAHLHSREPVGGPLLVVAEGVAESGERSCRVASSASVAAMAWKAVPHGAG